MTRWIKFDHINNARELGGMPVGSTHQVKNAMLYRTARLSKMSDQDSDKLLQMNIGLILDYRHCDEAQLNPTPTLNGITVENIPAMKTDAGVTEADFQKMIETLDFTSFISAMINTYKDMPFNNPAFVAMFDFIKQRPDSALLHHCTVGRDRTGVGTALILLLLGVERELILEDYLLSNEGLLHMQASIVENEAPALSEAKQAALLDAIRVKEDYLQATFDAIDEMYDSIEEYFEQEFQINKQIADLIREHYLVEKD